MRARRHEPDHALVEEAPPEQDSIRIPILPTQFDAVVVPVAPDEDMCGLMFSTLLTTTLVHITRGQTIELGSELLKMGRGMKRRPEKKKIEVITQGGLVVPT